MNLASFSIAFVLTLLSTANLAETRCVKDSQGNFTCRENSSPSPADLADIYGPWNPETYLQGRKQIEQSNLLQEQRLQQLRAENEKRILSNQYEAQNNALRLENQRLKNEALANSNAETRQRLDGQPLQLTQPQITQALGLSAAEVDFQKRRAETMRVDPDPTTQAKGQRLMKLVEAVIEVRQRYQRNGR